MISLARLSYNNTCHNHMGRVKGLQDMVRRLLAETRRSFAEWPEADGKTASSNIGQAVPANVHSCRDCSTMSEPVLASNSRPRVEQNSQGNR